MDQYSRVDDGVLPVEVCLHLVPGSEAVFLDATLQEEMACPTRIHIFFHPESFKLCGLRMEGDEGIDQARIRPWLLQGRKIAQELVQSLPPAPP